MRKLSLNQERTTMETQAPAMDPVKTEVKMKDFSLAQAMANLTPALTFISFAFAAVAGFFTVMYFVMDLRIAPIERDISELKARITASEARQEERYNQLIQRQDQIMQRQDQIMQRQEERHDQIMQYLLDDKKK